MSKTPNLLAALDESPLRRVHWRWTVLGALADYLDAGSAVAIGGALPLWIKAFHMAPAMVGILGLIGANSLSTAVAGFIAGRLGDRFGRKLIYTADLFVFMVGVLVLAAAVNIGMVFVGAVLVGLAIGADVTTSWTLIAEYSPARQRGKLMGLTNVFWYLGPIVSLLLLLVLHSLGMAAPRIVFLELAAVALLTWMMRRSMVESPRWLAYRGDAVAVESIKEILAGEAGPTGGVDVAGPTVGRPTTPTPLQLLFNKKTVFAWLVVAPLYIAWGIPAGTYGLFLPTILNSVGQHSLPASDGISILMFVAAIVSIVTVFMPLNDRVDRRILYACSAAMCAVAFFLLYFGNVKNPIIAIANVVLFGVGQGIGIWPLQRVWSVELFPTEVRNTGQGAIWSLMRMTLSIWKYFIPMLLLSIGLHTIALIFGILMLFSMVLGGIFGPRTAGKSLESISGTGGAAYHG